MFKGKGCIILLKNELKKNAEKPIIIISKVIIITYVQLQHFAFQYSRRYAARKCMDTLS
jgi:uncharacterized membrane protein (DUF106 family)